MYCFTKEEHFKFATSKDLTEDREVREEILEFNMPRTVYFGTKFAEDTEITKDIRTSELKWLISTQQHFKLSNTFLFHTFNCFHELLKSKPLVNDSSLRTKQNDWAGWFLGEDD